VERLKEKLGVAGRALSRLREVLALKADDVVRDSAIQRFEFSFETTWKAAQLYLRVVHGTEAASPKSVIREAFRVALLSEEETARLLAVTDDRNLTSHTYNEALAQALYERLPAHAALLAKWLAAMLEQTEPLPR
jgi:nucleotidyltransferase substrate binding protein (TIGR01987 family)